MSSIIKSSPVPFLRHYLVTSVTIFSIKVLLEYLQAAGTCGRIPTDLVPGRLEVQPLMRWQSCNFIGILKLNAICHY